MRFQVPQFTDVEDKLFGPLTIKQAIYLAGGIGIIVVCWTFLPKFIAFLLTIPVVVASIALAFWKINNQPFVVILQAFLEYTTNGKLYVWKKEEKKAQAREGSYTPNPQVAIPKLSNSKLKDLSWSLDVTKGNSGAQNVEHESESIESSGENVK
jgi:hypothetical protein